MTAGAEQIKIAFEEAGMTPAEIAEDLGRSLEAVQLTLMQVSPSYRKTLNKVEQKEEQDEMLQIIESIARTQLEENPSVALKAAKYLVEERKGRNDARAGIGKSQGINILLLDERFIATRKRIEEMKQKALGAPIIDVPA